MPLVCPPPPPVRTGGSSRRLSRIRRRRRSRNRHWADLPLDALLHIFHKLDHVDLMFGGASRACRSWRDAAREPELWRRIDLRGHSQLFRETIRLHRMALLATWFSAGQCIEFMGDDVGDDLICVLADQAPSLKSLHLTGFSIDNKVFVDAIKNWPLVEELELHTYYAGATQIVELVGRACPQLKHFKRVRGAYPADNRESLAIARMHELRSLHLIHLNLDNKALMVILDNCPHLEFLEIRDCCNVVVDSSLQAKFAKIKTKYIKPFRPIWHYYTYSIYPSDNDEGDCQFLYAEGHESEDSDYSCCHSRVEEIDFEEYERTFDREHW